MGINMDSLRHTEIVLMLNKIDLFKEKIKTVPLNECELFSDFDANIEEWQELYEATTRSIQDKFLSVSNRQDKREIRTYCFLTDATDKDSTQKIWLDTSNIPIRHSLKYRYRPYNDEYRQ